MIIVQFLHVCLLKQVDPNITEFVVGESMSYGSNLLNVYIHHVPWDLNSFKFERKKHLSL
jgi:hypothetical protein